MEIPLKMKIGLPYNPAVPFLSVYPEKNMMQKDACIPMFLVVLCMIAEIWMPPRCPSAEGCLRKMWCIYTMEYYSAIKVKTFVAPAPP